MVAWGYEFYLLVLKFVSPRGHVISSISSLSLTVFYIGKRAFVVKIKNSEERMCKFS